MRKKLAIKQLNMRLTVEEFNKLKWNAKIDNTTKTALVKDYINQDYLVKKAEESNGEKNGNN